PDRHPDTAADEQYHHDAEHDEHAALGLLRFRGWQEVPGRPETGRLVGRRSEGGRGLSRLEDGWWLGRGGVGARWLLRRVEGLPGLLLRGVKGLAGLLRRIEGWRRLPR